MVACFKYTARICITLLMLNKSSACKGTTEDEKIINMQPDILYISEGCDAVINWTYCKANVSSIVGFILFRDYEDHTKGKLLLLSMNLNGTVFHKDNNGHRFWNRIDLTENDRHMLTFTIKNLNVMDSGFFKLEIRRIGYGDLYSRVQVVVESRNHTDISSITSTVQPTSVPGPGPTSSREVTTIKPSHLPKTQTQENKMTKDVHSQKPVSTKSERSDSQRNVVILVASVITATIMILIITGIIMYMKNIKRFKRGEEENQQLKQRTDTEGVV